MNNFRKSITTTALTFLTTTLLVSPSVFAKVTPSEEKYSEEYKRWLTLSDEQKSETIVPRILDIEDISTNIIKNPLRVAQQVGAGTVDKYSLKDVIPESVKIKDQQTTNSCWAFSTLSSLETNLALQNKKNNVNTSKVYDFSERHMDYSSSKTFKNNQKSKYGYNRNAVTDPGNIYIASSYLTNGSGAVPESEMPFSTDSSAIDISEIQNKTVSSQVYDTVFFPDYSKQTTDSAKTIVMNKIKDHIKNYGSVTAYIHGGYDAKVINNNTGALYCDSSTTYPIDHAISIIGWDDNYSVNNFLTSPRPKQNGAWIVRNSYGEKIKVATLAKYKEAIFEQQKDTCIKNGWNSAEAIPDATAIKTAQDNGYTVENGVVYLPYADKGYIYVSYEDANVGKSMVGIVKASDKTDYNYIYQYDEKTAGMPLGTDQSKLRVCNFYTKQSKQDEYLTEVSIFSAGTYTYKVYVNPQGTNYDDNSLKEVELKAGKSETVSAGYHTFEFAKPIKINSDSFAVVIEIQDSKSKASTMLETKISNISWWDDLKTETGKCFVEITDSNGKGTWVDTSKLSEIQVGAINGDTSIKAFTITKKPAEYIDYSTEKTPEPKPSNNNNNSNNNSNNNKPETNNENNNQSSSETAKNSNFDNAKCNVNSVKYYTFSDKNKKEYMVIDLDVDGISQNATNDGYEYYYYLSPNSDEENISNWVKVSNAKIKDGKLSFEINTQDIKNYGTSSSANNLYVYIKEVAKKGNNESTLITNPMSMNSDVTIETYLNNAKVNTYNAGESNGNGNNNGNAGSSQKTSSSTSVTKSDATTATGSLPKTGKGVAIIALIAGIAVIAVILYRKYNSYKDIK